MWKKKPKDETLQERLQEQEREKNKISRWITFGAVTVILLACLGGAFSKVVDWAAREGEIAIATAAVVETRQAVQTATAEANAPTPGWEDPAEIVKLSVEQWHYYDFTGNFDEWAAEMCKYTTRFGCKKEVHELALNNWNDNVVPKQMQFTSTVTPVKMVWEKSYYDANAGHNIDAQVWEYKIVASDRPVQTFTRYVMISNEGAGWLFAHDLWDEEIAELLQEISADESTEVPTT